VKITVLTWIEREGTAEHDVVVDQVAAALDDLGHHVSILGVHDDLGRLVYELRTRRPELVFNLMEMFGDNLLGDVGVAGALDLLGIPYTGAGPGELYLRQDKALAKKLLAFEGILYPRFAVFARDAGFETGGGNLRMPLFVKPLRGDASIGVDGDSLVHDASSLMRRVLAIHEQVNDAALAEEYIAGRELYVGIVGNQEPQALPVVEMDFSKLPAGAPRVVGRAAKFEPGSAEFAGTRAVVAVLPDELRARVHEVALAAYRALRVRDYGRVDLRLTDSGDAYVIDVNASCYLEREGELALAASAAGIEYRQLVQRIVDHAVARSAGRALPVAVEALSAERAPAGASAAHSSSPAP
jgi:D-alanine-D-alanine ligase